MHYYLISLGNRSILYDVQARINSGCWQMVRELQGDGMDAMMATRPETKSWPLGVSKYSNYSFIVCPAQQHGQENIQGKFEYFNSKVLRIKDLRLGLIIHQKIF